MQKLQDSVFSIVKSTNLSAAVFSYLQPSEDFADKTPLGGILSDTKHGWLALGPKFCVVDLRTGLKVAARTFGAALSNFRTTVTSVVELPTPLTDNSQQLIISLECEDIAGMICVFHINGSQILRCIQTEVVVTQLAVCNGVPDGPFTCFDGILMAGTKTGEIFVFDLNRASLIQALKHISQGYEHMVRKEENASRITFLPLNAAPQLEAQRDLALENDDHIAVLLNESSLIDSQYIFRNPDGTVRMKAKRDHIRVTVIQYIPQLGSMAVGFNFGAFQIWNLLNLDLEFTSQVNVECLPVTNFGFQEPCDDPRAFCYLWVVFSVIDRFEEEEFPLAVMYSLTYQGRRMLSDTKCLYQDFIMATVRFQVELGTTDETAQLAGGRCVSCHTYTVSSTLGGEGEDSMLNICQLVWECWGEDANCSSQYGMLMFDIDQWYKDQMPATYQLQSNAFMSATCLGSLSHSLDVRLVPASVSVYCAATRLEEHAYPNSLHYNCICLNTSEVCVLSTIGIQRQIVNSLDEVGPTALLNPTRLYNACVSIGLTPLYVDTLRSVNQEEQRRYLLSVALEARLSRFLKRCAHDWATGSHAGAGCTLPFLVDWCWQRAIELKENAREMTAPLFTSSALPDRNVVRCLEHCVQQLTQLTGLLDAVLTKCCNLVVPDALSEMEEKYKGIGTVSLYFQVVQWLLRCGLLPERGDSPHALHYPASQLANSYTKRRLKLQRLQDLSMSDENSASKSCPLLYIDQLIEQEFGGERIHEMWMRGGSECDGLYPPPSLYSLLRLYLLPDIAEEHKHSLVLYLLVDYSMVYDEVRHEAVIRRLMQFPTMFGLSNTAIKATQAFWHLDHRDFDFALDQLQCLTGNTLSEWQHNVVLSSLLAQKKAQAALQYLHVRKPAPVTMKDDMNSSRSNEHDKLDDWQSCCNLYLARGLVSEALDVIRTCVHNAATMEDRKLILNYFYKGCRNTGRLSKILQVSLQPYEEEVFIRYLENCNDSQTSDILIMYYLQQARYLEAEQYNNKLKNSKLRGKELSTSLESLVDVVDREGARNTLLEVVCASLPAIANTVANCALNTNIEPHIIVARPMSVYVQAKSPKNTFTYKSSFIQDTIENASETWMNKPRMRKGLKRALNIEDTPFICTPKLLRTRSVFSAYQSFDSTPPKRPRLDMSGTPKTPKTGSAFKVSGKLSEQMATLLDMPEVQSPDFKLYERSGADTPHSILKIRSGECLLSREAPSPVDSRYLGDSDDEMLETASNQTHYSDTTNKHLRFTIPTTSESGSTPSPPTAAVAPPSIQDYVKEMQQSTSQLKEKEMDVSIESYVTTTESHAISEPNPMESPPKKLATEHTVTSRKSYKDSVRARRSLSISANSSLSEDPSASLESIADIPVTLINPRYSGERRRSFDYERSTSAKDVESTRAEEDEKTEMHPEVTESSSKILLEVPKTPKSRRSIRAISGESTPLLSRSRSVTPERQDSPVTPLRSARMTRSRSRTPEISPRSSPLEPILEQPKHEMASEPHPAKTTLSAPRQLRSKSRTPERMEKFVESPRLEAITESPTKLSDSPVSSPTRRSLRSRSRTPELELPIDQPSTPCRTRAKTPEKLMSPKKDVPKSTKKSLSRIVLEANAVKTQLNIERTETEMDTTESVEIIECTPMKSLRSVSNLIDVTISPIVNKSVLQSSNDSDVLTESIAMDKDKATDDSIADGKTLPNFTVNETRFGKSVLHSMDSTVGDTSDVQEVTTSDKKESISQIGIKSLPAFTLSETNFEKSILHSYESSAAETSCIKETSTEMVKTSKMEIKTSSVESFSIIDFNKSVLGSYESGISETSHDYEIKERKSQDTGTSKSVFKDVSSLMTSDSDIDVKDDEWKAKVDSQDTAAVIQKEKEKIVEIEREINEIEEDMEDDDDGDDDDESEGNESEDSNDDGIDVGNSDEDHVEGEESDDSSISSSDEAIASDEDDDDDDDDDDAISLGATESSATSNSVNLEIDEEPAARETPTLKTVQTEAEEVNVDKQIDQKTLDIVYDIEYPVESSEDPLNQAQVSLMTDDNSVRSDQSDIALNYSDETKDDGKVSDKLGVIEEIKTVEEEVPMETEKIKPVQLEVFVEVIPSEDENQEKMLEEVITETSEAEAISPQDIENYMDTTSMPTLIETKPNATSSTKETNSIGATAPSIVTYVATEEIEGNMETTDIPIFIETKPTPSAKESDVIDAHAPLIASGVTEEFKAQESRIEETIVTDNEQKQSEQGVTLPMDTITDDKLRHETEVNVKDKTASEEKPAPRTDKRAQSLASNSNNEQISPEEGIVSMDRTTGKNTSNVIEDTVKEKIAPKDAERPAPRTRKRAQSSTSNSNNEQKPPEEAIISMNETTNEKTSITIEDIKKVKTAPKDAEKPAPRTRKRVQSSASNKSFIDTEENVAPTEASSEEIKTPLVRKRSQSFTSNKSAVESEQKTAETDSTEMSTPSRRRAKTPTNTEVRRIVTRRASKEISEKLDESQMSIDESVGTPKRRTRSSSKNIDDNASIASGSSVRSTRSKASEDASEMKQPSLRKGRKSVVATKPDLSVIPEVVAEESAKMETSDIIKEYSTSRRLTRNQKAVLESWLEPQPTSSRRRSNASRASISVTSEHSHDDDDASSTHSAAFDVQPIDRISLLNKGDFEGSPDSAELQTNISPESIASDASKQRQRHLPRAVSETKSTPKAARINRRISADYAGEATESPAGLGSPSLRRRASFNRACEALHTPKGRRTSTDVRGDTESQPASPVPSESEAATPSRRGRRASTQSNTSLTKSDTGKRSKKTSTLEENKDSKME